MEIYKEKIEKYSIQALSLKKVLDRISLLRLFVFVIASAILITLFSIGLIIPFYIFLPISIVGFSFVLKHHNRITYLRKHTSILKRINESEIQREKGNLEEFDNGQEFINQEHRYTSDLDIFGQHSIFQLVNRTTTESSKIRLSEWLSEYAPNAEILDRQKAIKELAEKLDWRQDFQASGMHFQNKKSDYYKLLDWVNAPLVLLKYRRLYLALAIILSILFILSVFFFYVYLDSPMRVVYLSLLILVLITNLIILNKIGPQAENIVETSSENLKTLRGYQALIHKIEGENFTSKKLQGLQSIVVKDQYSAYNEIKRICKILDFSHQRPIKRIPIGGNYMYLILNNFLLLDIYLILRTEKWKAKNKAFLKSWAEAVSEFEVINSFAGFSYSNPTYAFPAIVEKDNHVDFEQLGHPLITSDKRVCNNFRSAGYGNVAMITGSNMGGKSTFLRAVGVNLVLGLTGAPCCAKYGQIANLKVFTSMRTQDNLMAGVSSFYAELSRIEQMLKLIESNENIYFLLDEVFKGTNSEDRHKGGFSLISQLSKLKTSGIIATHDIELAKLAGNKKLVDNFSFNSEIKGDLMIFSYELQPGICNDFNASELMKKSGIKVLSNITDQ